MLGIKIIPVSKRAQVILAQCWRDKMTSKFKSWCISSCGKSDWKSRLLNGGHFVSAPKCYLLLNTASAHSMYLLLLHMDLIDEFEFWQRSSCGRCAWKLTEAGSRPQLKYCHCFFPQNSHIMAKIYIYRTRYTYHSWSKFKGLLDQKSKHNHRLHINSQDQFRVRVWLELTRERAVCRHVTYNFVLITVMMVTCVD